MSADRSTIRHRAFAWSLDFPVDRLDYWIGFYGKMHADTKQPSYQADLEMLKQARRALKEEAAAAPTSAAPH
ncbi:hypothetical protein LAZ40_09255 [Cereibacter sphaeroides]|uniref:hypothetical protein n=1 Tax=Cereibacter sphaeroides TaxID=1063 RepID=UPI001F3B4527|nr:hypothetical protein [Cereibacter sphaeroides]MCE6959238.1 hypothetical protein [Cereibacter sphaeroides]MCE6972041.1 hypothetical protein [Cereibacter sphaeroides]